MLHTRDSVVSGHGLLTPAGGEETERTRQDVPPPQRTVQLLHELHAPILHSSQTSDEHGSVTVSDGHTAPPNAAASAAKRERRESPVEHGPSHSDHSPQLVTKQSTGQGNAKHDRTSLEWLQSTPPANAGVKTERALTVFSEPQVVEHRPHASHSLMTQSIGHSAATQPRSSVRDGQAEPLPLGATEISRERLMLADTPQLTEQELHASQAATLQSTGHSKALHSLPSSVSGHEEPAPE